MKLSTKRQNFTYNMALLILHASGMGYRPVAHEVYRHETSTHGHPRSTHRSGLAVDLILYNEDGSIYEGEKWFDELHDVWDTLGGAERIIGDLGHFSVKHNGVR